MILVKRSSLTLLACVLISSAWTCFSLSATCSGCTHVILAILVHSVHLSRTCWRIRTISFCTAESLAVLVSLTSFSRSARDCRMFFTPTLCAFSLFSHSPTLPSKLYAQTT
jgi:F0F1-type ATP synthase assembly protein I